MKFSTVHLILTGLAALIALPLSASTPQSPPPFPPPTPEILPALHAAFDGDQWIYNDGWLDEEVFFCDWYGVKCVEVTNVQPSYWQLEAIDLSGNNLNGEFTAELSTLLFTTELKSLDLSNNLIRGTLDRLFIGIGAINLADNLLEGPLPRFSADIVNTPPPPTSGPPLVHLNLARNRFSGAVPPHWHELQLKRLDLADNRLDANPQNAFAAMSTTDPSQLYLTGNRFSGELGPEIMSAALNKRDVHAAQGGGLDLCFNQLSTTSDQVDDWISVRHAGSADWQACQNLDRQEITPAISGSWFNPQRSGEGFSLLLMENGAPLLYHFGFGAEGRQQWLFEVGYTEDVFLRWGTLYETAGFFNKGISQFTEVEDALYLRDTGRMRIDFLANGELSVLQHIGELARCGPWRPPPPYPPPPDLCVMPWYESRAQYIQLTELSGATDCSLRNPLRHYSGAWFNPERTGEGFMVEVMDNNDALVYWFTHEPESAHGEDVAAADQAWMMGLGTIEWIPGLGDVAAVVRLEVDLIQPIGGQGGYDFDPELVEQIDWGTLVLQFNQEDAGWATWASNVTGYGEGEYEIERLARPMLANCD